MSNRSRHRAPMLRPGYTLDDVGGARRLAPLAVALILLASCTTSKSVEPSPEALLDASTVAAHDASSSTSVTTATSSSTTSTTVAPIRPTTSAPAAVPTVTPARAAGWPWDPLADCESGEWNRDGEPIAGTARWDDHDDPPYEGGVHFDYRTWDAYRDPTMPEGAHLASRDVQIVVAERVLAAEGWRAWPVCSRKIGAR